MRKILIIGMGTFGQTLAIRLNELGNEVVIVDRDEEVINELSNQFSSAYIADCSNINVLSDMDVEDFDVVFVAIAGDFQASLEITSLLSELNAKNIISKAKSELQAKFLLKVGADEIVFPERDIAYKLAFKFSTRNIFDFIEIEEGFGVYEIRIPDSWAGKKLIDMDVRRKNKINVLAVKKSKTSSMETILAEHVFSEKELVLVMGKEKDVKAIS